MQMSSGVYIYIYIFVMAFATWLMRVAASLVMKKPIENRFFQSFLYYVPYVTLAVMTFPAIITATDNMWSGIAALIVGLLAAWFKGDLFFVAVSCCATVFLTGIFL
jgi:branched-subunit amino acid transport protein